MIQQEDALFLTAPDQAMRTRLREFEITHTGKRTVVACVGFLEMFSDQVPGSIPGAHLFLHNELLLAVVVLKRQSHAAATFNGFCRECNPSGGLQRDGPDIFVPNQAAQ